jgi:hypothetical protein
LLAKDADAWREAVLSERAAQLSPEGRKVTATPSTGFKSALKELYAIIDLVMCDTITSVQHCHCYQHMDRPDG